MISLKDLIETRDGSDYQRDNFDDFLKKVKFSFTIPSIHIAGTCGKTTVAEYIASIYQSAGYKVGLFTSPCLYEINEMVKINGENIPDSKLEEYVLDVKKEIKKYDLSYFEVMTYVAFEYFKDNKCDICVIECGMGGEEDATNVFDPVLSIITSISLEHTNYLGRSISEIAETKGGIIKDEVPVLINELPLDAIDVISNIAKERESKIYTVGKPHQPVMDNEGYEFTYGVIKNIHINSKAFYAVEDACLAIDAINVLNNQFPVKHEDIKDGLKKANPLFKLQQLDNDPLTFLDSAHNPEACENLLKTLQKGAVPTNIRALLSCFKDKNLIQMLNAIGSIADTIVLTTFDNPRARDEDDFFLFLSDYEFNKDPIEAYKKLKELYPEDIILITGSAAFCAYMYKRLK